MSPKRVWQGLALALALLATLLMAWPPQDPGATVRARAPGTASAPESPPPPADPAAELAVLAASSLWGAVAAPAPVGPASAASPAPVPSWLLSGTYATPDGRRVVLHFEGKALPSQQLGVGDRLPDQGRILAIEPDRVRVQPAGQARRRAVWHPINRVAPADATPAPNPKTP